MIVRLERPDDRDASVELERLAFGSDEEPRIVEAVRDERGSFALVADDDGIVGHVQFSTAWVGADEVLALGPIGVRPERQGRGVGRSLVEGGLEEARRRGIAAVILLGDPAFYSRFGFEPAARHGWRNPYAGMEAEGFVVAEEDFQVAVLDPERVASMSGEVRWHPAFG